RDADPARLAGGDHLGERAERLLHRDVVVERMALVQVDIVHPEPFEGCVDLRENLLAREPATAVGSAAEDLRRDDVRVARPAGERAAEHFLRAALAVDVRRVEEVDAAVERRVHEGDRIALGEAAAERRPRSQADLGDSEIAVAELPVVHASVSIWARWSLP